MVRKPLKLEWDDILLQLREPWFARTKNVARGVVELERPDEMDMSSPMLANVMQTFLVNLGHPRIGAR